MWGVCVCVRKKSWYWLECVLDVFHGIGTTVERGKGSRRVLSMSIRCSSGWLCLNWIDVFIWHHLAMQDTSQRLAMVSSLAFESMNSFGIAWQELHSSHSPWGNKNGKTVLGKNVDGKWSFQKGEQNSRHRRGCFLSPYHSLYALYPWSTDGRAGSCWCPIYVVKIPSPTWKLLDQGCVWPLCRLIPMPLLEVWK